MLYRKLDTVMLLRELPAHNLHPGDKGAVVEIYEPDGLEIEFVTTSGKTRAVVTLDAKDVALAPGSRKLENGR